MESRIELTDRLRRAGRWKEASQFREDERVLLRLYKHFSRDKARESSWQAMAAKFPPLASVTQNEPPEVESSVDELVTAELVEHLESMPPTKYARVVLCVYDKLGVQDVTAANAPSAGAWEMHRWARNNKERFFEQMLPKAQQLFDKRQEAQPESEVIEEDLTAAEDALAELDAMVAASDENYGFEKFAPEIRGILESLANDEPLGDLIRREARYTLAESEKLQKLYKPERKAMDT